jgi:hypothetical protein
MNEPYFELLWEIHKPAKKLPQEFEKKLKESMYKMLTEVWNTSLENERKILKKNFSDFVDGKYNPDRFIATA